ncbi:hypothetical protein N7478_001691 [Penicillium angulare]|uniref:uncharacterized protein n=1 Tax=Penicillium angulare TaxID=116970 RepID=UPI00253FF361|nr:uncharacterized protein N7478_001691 [Penicillium angulare]KAJ5288661.1 hypothetical protein N7478_001691 [Penicillium angulare]
MKTLTALVCLASLGLALPIHESRDQTHSTLSSYDSRNPQKQQVTVKKIEYHGTDAPVFEEYTVSQRQLEELPFIRSNEKEFNISDRRITQQGLLKSSASKSSSQYGIFLGKSVSFTHHKSAASAYRKSVDILDLLDRHGPECVGISIFVLVPIAYFILELLELVFKFFVPERFPERGRGRLKLLGPERQIRALGDLQREKTVETQRYWWQGRRIR